MSFAHEAIYGKLTNTVAVTTLCSTRVYPNMIPQNAKLPAIGYWKVYDVTVHAMGRDPSVMETGFQLDIFSTSLSQLLALSAAARNTLRDYSGSTWCPIQRIFFEGQTENAEIDPESKLITHRAIQEYTIWWNT